MTQAKPHYQAVRALVRERCGISFNESHDYLIESRLMPIVRSCKLPGIDRLMRLVASGDTELAARVVHSLANHETLFFRDRKPFQQLQERFIPALLEKRATSLPVRIWSAGCSTGQEIYSIAMLFDGLRLLERRGAVELTATDFAGAAVDRAAAGRYSQFEVQRGLPVALLLRHFTQNGTSWQITERLRQAVRFSVQNLLDDFSALGRFDVIFCRNVLMYFDLPTRRQVLAALAQALRPGGYLLTGHADAIGEETSGLVKLPGDFSGWECRVD